jgi:hypothetical protein
MGVKCFLASESIFQLPEGKKMLPSAWMALARLNLSSVKLSGLARVNPSGINPRHSFA